MSSLHWNSAIRLPFEIRDIGGSQRHHVAVHEGVLRLRPHHASRTFEIELDRFIDIVAKEGEIHRLSEFTAVFELSGAAAATNCWIAFTQSEVVVKASGSKARRSVGFERLKSIVTVHGKPIGGVS